MKPYCRVVLFIALLLLSNISIATNGYFAIGYGSKSLAMGGSAIAYPQDGLVASANPAGMSKVAEGWDVGIRFLSSPRTGEIDCSGIGFCDGTVSDRSSRDMFLVPNFSYVRKINERIRFGLSAYGNGGINTSYGQDFYVSSVALINNVPPPTRAKLGIDFSQLIFAPTLSYSLNDKHVLGIAPLLAVQKLSTRGLQAFAPLSAAPESLSNRGSAWSYGAGVRIGWLYQLNSKIQLGAAYASKIYMSKFDKYDGLLVNSGEFDIPSNFGFGLAIKINDRVDFAFDVVRILYSDIDSLSNPVVTMAELGGVINPERRLGAANGIGFGWESIWAVKAGVKYQWSDKLSFRLGTNHGQKQIPKAAAIMNIISPAIPQHHITFGASYRGSTHSEWSLAYMHAFKNTESDTGSPLFGATASYSIWQNSLDLTYSRQY